MDQQLSAGWEVDDPDCRQPVHRSVAAWAAERPGAPAITCADGTLGYRELDERANRLANHLRALGVGRDVVVAIHLDRGLDHYVTLLAVLKAGGAALPLDTTYPAARLGYMLDDSGARVLVTRGTPPATEGAGPRAVVDVEADAERIAGYPPTAPPDEVSPADLAYVMYTSASTGPPKGVQLEHGGIANLCRWHIAALGLTSADCGSLAAPLSFDASIVDLWPMLVAGARTVAVPDDARTDLAGLARVLRDNRVTVCFLTTALAELFLAQPGLEDLPLRYLVTGGEALRRRPRPRLPFRLVNIYGPTETTVYVTSVVVDDAVLGSGPIPIGYPIGGVDVRLLDPDGAPVPPGQPGEIVVAGPGIARGYIGQAELTAQRFRPDGTGARTYRTGDLARRRPDGCLEFLGRLDRQVKVRGHRIEPEEIERTLLEHPAVRQAAVAVLRPTPDSAQLVAYVEADPDAVRDPLGASDAPRESRPADDVELTAAIQTLAPSELLLTAEQSSVDELLAGIASAVERTADGGTVLVGGVRSLPLLAAAHAWTELKDAPDDATTEELRWRVRGALLAETELAVHPAAFATLTERLGRVAAMTVRPRCLPSGVARYDVLVRVGDAGPAPEVTWLDWAGDGLDLTAVRRLLLAKEHRALGVRRIPHGQVSAWIAAAEAIGGSTTAGQARQAGRIGATGPEPIDLVALSIGVPYRTVLSVAAGRPDGSVDAVWLHDSVPDDRYIRWPGPDSAAGPLGNRPRHPASGAELQRSLRELLAENFVAHEMPDLFVVLDRMPLTPVGKVDRNALPPPHWLTGTGRADGPRTPVEEAVTDLVAAVLGRRRVGRTEDLRALGAHSLSMTQVAARITARFGVTVPIRTLLAEPTVEAIACGVERATARTEREAA